MSSLLMKISFFSSSSILSKSFSSVPTTKFHLFRESFCKIVTMDNVREMSRSLTVYESGVTRPDDYGFIYGLPNCFTEENDSSVSPNGSVLCNMSWQRGELRGSGSIGIVYEGFTENEFFFAVKEISLLHQCSQGQQILSNLEQDIFLLRQLRHENIVCYLGIDKDDDKLYVFLELVTEGSLVKLYEKGKLHDSKVSAYTRQILNGLNYLHSQNVVHRDIKCANILVDASRSVKLADFGLAKVSPRWMAPEVVNQKNHHGYGLAADIWSLGCTVLEMLTRQFPYSDLESMEALVRIGRGELPPLPDTLSKDARDFILECLQVHPEDRPTAAQLLEHPFVKKPPSTFPSPISPRHRALPRS